MAINALSTFLKGSKGLPTISDDQLADALEAGQQGMEMDTSAVQYLTFSGKSGNYSLGRGKDEVDPEAVYVLEPQSFTAGWMCWKGNKPIARHEWSFFRPDQAVPQADLEDHGPYKSDKGEGWAEALSFGVCSTDGHQTSIKFGTSTKSARNAIADMIDEVKKRARAKEAPIPVIHFESEEFTAQDQKNYKPKFVVEAWVTRKAAEAFYAGTLTIDQLSSGEAAPKRVAGKQPPKKAPAKAKR